MHTAAWVGLRIFALPVLVFAGGMALKGEHASASDGVASAMGSASFASLEAMMPNLGNSGPNILGFGAGSFTSNVSKGAKWVRP
jgi:hypothetical protein